MATVNHGRGASSLPQPQDNASILLSAFKASTGTPPHATRSHRITMADLTSMFSPHS